MEKYFNILSIIKNLIMKEIREKVVHVLERKNYEVFISTGCFDVAAKKRNFLLLLKILKNIDSFLPSHATSLKALSFSLDAHPFLIGRNTNYEKLLPGVVYERFEIPAMNVETFELVLENEIPEIWRDRGGRYIEIDPIKLKVARKEKKLTQSKLAELVGVSKKTIYIHEKSRKRASVEIVEKIEHVLEKKIRASATLFRKFSEISRPSGNLESYVEKKLKTLGFSVSFVKKAPCDAVAREKNLIASEIEENRRRLEYRAKKFESFLDFIKCKGIVITNRFKVELSVPVVEKRELEKIETKEEFLKLIEDF